VSKVQLKGKLAAATSAGNLTSERGLEGARVSDGRVFRAYAQPHDLGVAAAAKLFRGYDLVRQKSGVPDI
jgi:hypothetical protein